MSPESAESVKSVFEIAGVILLGVTFLAGLGFWYFSRKVSEFQEERLRTFDKELIDSKTSLANAEIKRLELEKTLAPRRLNFITYTDGTNNFDNLKPLAGTEFIIEAIPDFEARQAAGNIQALLVHAGFKVIKTALTEEFTRDGVTVLSYEPLDNEAEEIGKGMASSQKAEILGEFFDDNDWISSHVLAKRGELKLNMLLIRVGYKPSPFFSESKEPEWVASMKQRGRRTPPLNKNKPRHSTLRLEMDFPNKPK